MKYKQLLALADEDREKKMLDTKKELMKLNAQVLTGTTPKSPGQISQLKKIMAKLTAIKKLKEKNG